MTDEPEPSNIIDMNTQARLIREAREARAKRKAERQGYSVEQLREIGLKIIGSPDFQEKLRSSEKLGAPYCPIAIAIMKGEAVQFPGGIDDMELG